MVESNPITGLGRRRSIVRIGSTIVLPQDTLAMRGTPAFKRHVDMRKPKARRRVAG